MAVSRDDVLRVAALARLELSDDEVDGMARELSGILSHVEALRIDHRSSIIDHRASIIEHRAAGTDRGPGAARLRADEPDGDALSGGPGAFAPAFRDGFFLVPRLGSHGPSTAGNADGDGDGDGDAE